MALKFIIFDLDDTLYSRESGLMQEVGRRIQIWLCHHLGLTWEEAVALRREYFYRYGTTLGGLIARHNVDVHDYLAFVHDIPVEEYVRPDPALEAMLASIPLRKAIYTNATSEYGWRVLRALGVADHFERVIGIEEVGLRNKPYPDAYERMLARLGARGPECIMVEDSARNLRPAKALGMTTVLVGTEPDEDGDVDFVVGSVLEVGQVVARVLNPKAQSPKPKSRVSTDKVASLADAAALVHDGDTLALGGMTLYRRPVAFVRALLQREQPPRDLTLLCFTAGFESDLLVGAGLVRRVRTCYFGLEAFGLAPMFTQAATAGTLEVVEETEASLAFGLRATLAGVGFMPGRGWLGTAMLKVRPDVQVITDPYTGEEVVAFPAIACDVAVIHALRADRTGNAVLGGNLAVDVELSLVAERVIVTAEEVVERLEGPLDLSGIPVTAVVHTPRGAWPTSCYPLYPVGGEELLRYAESCPGGFEEYLIGLLAQRV